MLGELSSGHKCSTNMSNESTVRENLVFNSVSGIEYLEYLANYSLFH